MGPWGCLTGRFSNPSVSPIGEVMPVYYKCRVCEDEHLSPIVIDDKRAFQSSSLMTLSFHCPVRGKSAIYDKDDMFWKD
jgi:hypothetical protein